MTDGMNKEENADFTDYFLIILFLNTDSHAKMTHVCLIYITLHSGAVNLLHTLFQSLLERFSFNPNFFLNYIISERLRSKQRIKTVLITQNVRAVVSTGIFTRRERADGAQHYSSDLLNMCWHLSWWSMSEC